MSDPSSVKTVEELKTAPEEYREGYRQAGDQPRRQRALRRAGVRRAAIAYAPTPYAKWLTCRVAMEEYGHHVRFKHSACRMGIPRNA